MLKILLMLLLFPSVAFASAIWGTVSGDVSGDVEVDFYRTECADDVLEHTTLTNPGGFYYYSFNKTGTFTVIPSKDGYTVEPESKEYLIPDLTTTIANVDFVTTSIIVDRYIDNGDGTIYDSVACVTWLKDANCFEVKTFLEAKATVNALEDGMCGLSDNSSACDWHMPSWVMLQRLGSDNATAWGWDVEGLPWTMPNTPFTNVQDNYWTTNGVADRCEDARFIDMTTGFIWVNAKTTPYSVLPFKLPIPIEECP